MDDELKDWFECIPRQEQRLCPVTDWEPPADVYQTSDGWLIKVDLSGVRPEDLRVSISGRRLSIAGMRRDQTQHLGFRCYRMEISYNSFHRTIELPNDVDAGRGASCEFDSGMLLVRLYERKS